MMDAKKALTETDGDMEAAVDWLRTKGLAKAAKKSGRTAAEGLVAVASMAAPGVAVEVNSETDFVAKNAEFQEMVASIAPTSRWRRRRRGAEGRRSGRQDGRADRHRQDRHHRREHDVRRMAKLEGDNVVSYVHNAAAPGMGKIGVLVALTGGDEASAAGRDACRRREPGLAERGRSRPGGGREGKAGPDGHRPRKRQARAVIEKMIVGRMKKFLAEVTLLNQQFVVNPDLTVGPPPRRPASRSPASSGSRSAKASRSRRRLRRRGRQGRQGLTSGNHARWCATHPERRMWMSRCEKGTA
jgi:elongation factor Ts